MDASLIDKSWPNSLRWFLCQNLQKFTPWHFIESASDFEFAARAFKYEDLHGGEVFVFASRQDCDDFAGLEIKSGKITDKVIHFHPTFASAEAILRSPRTWNIVCGVFDDVFDFVSKQVVPDMKDWAMTEDAKDL